MAKKTEIKSTDFYVPRDGGGFSKEKTQIYGQELQKIADLNDGSLSPQQVVEVAKSKYNPLHEVFDWDDTSAAEKYRLEQARYLIRAIYVQVKWDSQSRQERAFFNVTDNSDEDNSKRVYVKFDRVLSDAKLREQVIANAIREIEYWKRKYEIYREFSAIFSSIQKTKKKLGKKIKLKVSM